MSPTLGNVLFAVVLLILASDGFFKIKTAWEFRKAGRFGKKPEPKRCSYDPMLAHPAVGMHHCPECGEMVIANVPHPDYSLLEDQA